MKIHAVNPEPRIPSAPSITTHGAIPARIGSIEGIGRLKRDVTAAAIPKAKQINPIAMSIPSI